MTSSEFDDPWRKNKQHAAAETAVLAYRLISALTCSDGDASASESSSMKCTVHFNMYALAPKYSTALTAAITVRTSGSGDRLAHRQSACRDKRSESAPRRFQVMCAEVRHAARRVSEDSGEPVFACVRQAPPHVQGFRKDPQHAPTKRTPKTQSPREVELGGASFRRKACS